jgi:diguanylate cyclase (GGDEF)-like protein/PAS domain S-box-containing protein
MAGSQRKEYKLPDKEGARLSIDWKHTFDIMTDFVAIMDTQYRIVRINKAMAAKLNVKPGNATGSYCYKLVHDLDSPPSYCPFTELIKDGQEHAAEVHEDRLGGDFVVTVSPWRDSRNRLAGCVHVAKNVTEHKRAEQNRQRIYKLLQVQATTDALTGICNRQKFCDFLNHEIQESRRYGHPLSLIMFDIDFFKQINDRYGHKVGDDVLRETTRLISENIRDVDVFARWGGEEFMILSPHSELKSTKILADKLRALIEQHRYHSCPEPVTCSFGIVTFSGADTVESFTNRADIAMYKAKKNGRNRVETGS